MAIRYINILLALLLTPPSQLLASKAVEWGFGIQPGQAIETLNVYEVNYKLPFGMSAVKPPASISPFTFYGATTNKSGRVSGVVGMANFRSWKECETAHYQIEVKLKPMFGEPANSKNQGDWVIVFRKENSEVRLACQPIESGEVKSRLLLLFTDNSLIQETVKMDPEATKRASDRLNENQSLFNR